MKHNSPKRAFAEVVSLDAWHDRFGLRRKRADLHVDVAFLTGRIGEAPDSHVRFKLSLKRAEVVVIVPETEPARIILKSVRRDAPQLKVTAVQTQDSNKSAAVSAKIHTKTNPSVPIDFSTDLSAIGMRKVESKVKIIERCDSFRVTQTKNPDGHNVWVIEPSARPTLEGRPWNALQYPRMQIDDTRPNREIGIAPIFRIEIRCKREDLHIYDIVLKNASITASIKDRFFRNKMLAAEALIRTRLSEAGLLHGDLGDSSSAIDPFAPITMSAIIAEEQ